MIALLPASHQQKNIRVTKWLMFHGLEEESRHRSSIYPKNHLIGDIQRPAKILQKIMAVDKHKSLCQLACCIHIQIEKNLIMSPLQSPVTLAFLLQTSAVLPIIAALLEFHLKITSNFLEPILF